MYVFLSHTLVRTLCGNVCCWGTGVAGAISARNFSVAPTPFSGQLGLGRLLNFRCIFDSSGLPTRVLTMQQLYSCHYQASCWCGCNTGEHALGPVAIFIDNSLTPHTGPLAALCSSRTLLLHRLPSAPATHFRHGSHSHSIIAVSDAAQGCFCTISRVSSGQRPRCGQKRWASFRMFHQ
jgi:hypothetical protein